jgi:hypothetical protein
MFVDLRKRRRAFSILRAAASPAFQKGGGEEGPLRFATRTL